MVHHSPLHICEGEIEALNRSRLFCALIIITHLRMTKVHDRKTRVHHKYYVVQMKIVGVMYFRQSRKELTAPLSQTRVRKRKKNGIQK